MADGTKSFLLRYVGDRFNGTRLPVEVLSDLSAFRDLLVAFAKEKWRDQHGRERVPKGPAHFLKVRCLHYWQRLSDHLSEFLGNALAATNVVIPYGQGPPELRRN